MYRVVTDGRHNLKLRKIQIVHSVSTLPFLCIAKHVQGIYWKTGETLNVESTPSLGQMEPKAAKLCWCAALKKNM